MKKLILLIFGLLTLIACNKEVETEKTPKLDPNAQLTLNASATKAIPSAPYSMNTVVRYAYETMFIYDSGKDIGLSTRQGIPKRDIDGLKFWIGEARSVVRIDESGVAKLGPLLTTNLRDLVVVAMYRKDFPDRWIHHDDQLISDQMDWHHYDTIGYVPNRVIQAAEIEIRKAFDAGDYAKCTQLFETAYVFQPITGPEWRALKAKNEQ